MYEDKALHLEDKCVPSVANCRERDSSSRLSSEAMSALQSWSWFPSQETMQQMAEVVTAVYVKEYIASAPLLRVPHGETMSVTPHDHLAEDQAGANPADRSD
jgi:hypothetical protein